MDQKLIDQGLLVQANSHKSCSRGVEVLSHNQSQFQSRYESLLKKAAVIDFEFGDTAEKTLRLVCMVGQDLWSGKITEFDLTQKSNWGKCYQYLESFDTLIAHASVAECRSILSLDKNCEPENTWNIFDTFFEYRCLTNHSKMAYGPQLVDGKVKQIPKPKNKWQRAREGIEDQEGFKPTHSLAEAYYKLCGKIIDETHKDNMRDLILGQKTYTKKELASIIGYCRSDVVACAEMVPKILDTYFSNDFYGPQKTKKQLVEEIFLRGEFGALTAKMEMRGYPVNVEEMRNFSSQVGSILYTCQREIADLFPDIKPFSWDRKENRMKWNQKAARKYIETLPFKKDWPLTAKKQLSLKLETFERFFDFDHEYPADIYGAQVVRYLKLKRSMNGFTPAKGKKNIWDSVGSDGRVRAYLNPFGAQSSRSQPGSTAFIPLKPAWQRSLIQPSAGWYMASHDYSSQEFLIQALLSEDEEMFKAYCSGDVYLAFAIAAGLAPKGATKQTHKRQRDFAKALVLGMSYLMSAPGLARHLSNILRVEVSVEEAQGYIDLFYEVYSNLKGFQECLIHGEDAFNPGDVEFELLGYLEDKKIVLPDGWTMWGENDNLRSVVNVPTQGFAASVLRRAIKLAEARKARILYPLHDALYNEDKIGNEKAAIVTREAMVDAFAHYFKSPTLKAKARQVRVDSFFWSPNYEADSKIIVEGQEFDCSNLMIDERAVGEYEKFKQYFKPNVGLDL